METVFRRRRDRDRTWDDAPPWAVDLKKHLSDLTHTQEKIMKTLDDVLTLVTENSDALDSLSTLITGLRAQVTDALSGLALPPQVQAKVEAIFAKAEAEREKINTALNANVTPAPVEEQPADPAAQ